VTRRDIIPDIHADPQRLDATLAALGDKAPLAFLGDFIDHGQGRGDDLAVLTRMRGLIEERRALAVMGNHELNAILFHRPGPDGAPMRYRNDKNIRQHRSFLAQFGTATPAALDWTGWFLRTLPLWRDLGSIRLVHACWNEAAIATIARRRPDGLLHEEDLPEINDPASAFGAAVRLLTSGHEVPLPDGAKFHDRAGHARSEVRLAWWPGRAGTWAEAALSVENRAELPAGPVPQSLLPERYAEGAPPVFVGHYKMQDRPRIEAANVVCLDYPHQACAYRWHGEARLDPANLLLI
jgi:hypothetical protein